jgi:AcrR family transcriptional regulator
MSRPKPFDDSSDVREPARVFPDPYLPSPRPERPQRDIGEPYFPPGREAQRNRRANILACARQLIGRTGPEQVIMRTLAEESGTAVQTIYNLIGGRELVLEMAINEHILALNRHAKAMESRYPHLLLAMADTYGTNVRLHPEYSRQSMRAWVSDALLHKGIVLGQCRLLTAYLLREKKKNIFRNDTDMWILAKSITMLTYALSIEHTLGLCDFTIYRRQLVFGYSYLLFGTFNEIQADHLRQWLRHWSA